MNDDPRRQLTVLQSLNEAMAQILEADPDVFIIGEDIGRHGGSFQATSGLQEQFGPGRVWDAPISEAGFVGLAVGAAMTGLRPIVDLMFADFIALAMDQVVNQAAKTHYMSGEQLQVPLVIRAAQGAGSSSAAQHSQTVHSWFANVPGLKIVLPSNARDAKGLLAAAVNDPNPVLFLEDKKIYGSRGPVPEELFEVPLGKAAVVRPGSDATVVATAHGVTLALEAAEAMSDRASVEVIDLRTIAPLDVATVLESVGRTGRAVIVDEAPTRFGVGAELSATIAEEAFDFLEEPVGRVGSANVPVPFARDLERAVMPSSDDVVAAIEGVLR